ncbi:MAG: NADPH-dependent F420 reductase [Alphaproteobacteria bacterium]
MDKPSIAIIGGSGDLGSGLALRWAKAGYPVILGSRDRAKAAAAAAELATAIPGARVGGEGNVAAAASGSVIVITVPYSSHGAILNEIRQAVQGKIVVDTVVPLVPPKVSVVQPPEEGSAAKIARSRLGPGVRVTSAFHNVSAKKLRGNDGVDCDVLVFGDDKEARDLVIGLADATGARGVDGGALENSLAAEALTSVLIGINRRYKIGGAGIRITGIPPSI